MAGKPRPLMMALSLDFHKNTLFFFFFSSRPHSFSCCRDKNLPPASTVAREQKTSSDSNTGLRSLRLECLRLPFVGRNTDLFPVSEWGWMKKQQKTGAGLGNWCSLGREGCTGYLHSAYLWPKRLSQAHQLSEMLFNAQRQMS